MSQIPCFNSSRPLISILRRCLFVGMLLCVLGVASPSQSQETKSAWFTTPGHDGAVVLEIPKGWSHRSKSHKGQPTRVTLVTGKQNFKFTVLRNAADSPDFNSSEQLQASLRAASTSFTANNANSDFELQKLSGSQVSGFYATLTDPNYEGILELGPDDYPILTPGIFSVGELQVFFTLFSQTADTPARLLALEMFSGTRFEADASSRVRNENSVPVIIDEESFAPLLGDAVEVSPKHESEGHQH